MLSQALAGKVRLQSTKNKENKRQQANLFAGLCTVVPKGLCVHSFVAFQSCTEARMPKVPLAVKHEFLLFVPVCCTSVPKRPRLGKRSRIHAMYRGSSSTTFDYKRVRFWTSERENREAGKKRFFFSLPSSFSTLRLKLLCA